MFVGEFEREMGHFLFCFCRMSELPRVVILGPSKSGKKTLLQGLVEW